MPAYDWGRAMRGNAKQRGKDKPKHEPEVQRRINIAATNPPKQQRRKGKPK